VKALLFDLDGTLLEPEQGICGSIEYAIRRLGLKVPERSTLRRFIGPPLFRSFETLHTEAVPDAAAEERAAWVQRAVTLYRERYAAIGMYENEVYCGIPALLAGARELGFRLCVATSKPRTFAQPILSHFRLSEYFHAIYGSELDGRRGEKSELLTHLLAEEKMRASDALMIGDRFYDIVGARANGITALGVAWGHGSVEELDRAGAARVFASPAELLAFLRQKDWPELERGAGAVGTQGRSDALF
jgi:phosphoglycolate phosphatase